MTLTLGARLRVRTMVYVAAEPIPFLWPMRTFIHHNPLHGLEHMPFSEGVDKGAELFHARAWLPRSDYQRYYAEGVVDRTTLESRVAEIAAQQPELPGIDLQRWLLALMTQVEQPVVLNASACTSGNLCAKLRGGPAANPEENSEGVTKADLVEQLESQLLNDRPLYESVDQLFGTHIANDLDELVIKSCLDFFDEGQSVWGMPKREQGFFEAWRELASHSLRLSLKGLRIKPILESNDSAEDVIAYVMRTLGVDEKHWASYFTRELSHLHGWAGFIRWRSASDNYYWAQRHPADLVDFLAVRLTLALGLLNERARQQIPISVGAMKSVFAERTEEIWLRNELYSGKVLPALAQRVESALLGGKSREIKSVFADYLPRKCAFEFARQGKRLNLLAQRAGAEDALAGLSEDQVAGLLESIGRFESAEGMIWLQSMESHAMGQLLDGLSYQPAEPREKRPFVQAMFCIDTRSERIRRHLEEVGDYQTFGTAGFFGVPISFMELGKGSENHLCPVLLTPKNLVIEMTTGEEAGEATLGTLEKALHGLKESVLTPFVTVEAVGLLFGFDMIGKTVAPMAYNRWRKHLDHNKPATHLLIDKIDREQADSVVRAVQRAVIIKAVEQDLEITPERMSDALVRELRENALGHTTDRSEIRRLLGLGEAEVQAFIDRLSDEYQINSAYSQLQMERLARIGFTLDEQVNFVTQALSSIGLVSDCSRFVLLVGHGSASDNNPYESALDCGACGGDHGLVSARVLARMANKAAVRRRLRKQGIEIADDAWFIPAMHNTTTDQITLHDLDQLPSTHLVYLDRLRQGLLSASRLCARERLSELSEDAATAEPAAAYRMVQRNAMDWSQVRPEWGLSRNAYFIIGRRHLTQSSSLDGRAFLHSYDYRVDTSRRLLESILTGPLVVGQWINMEHYFSTVDNERFGSGSKVVHNVAGRFGVMTGNLSDLRTGLPSQTVLDQGVPYHQPLRLITVIEAPIEHARYAIESVASVKQLVRNGWIRVIVIDPEAATINFYQDGQWRSDPQTTASQSVTNSAVSAS